MPIQIAPAAREAVAANNLDVRSELLSAISELGRLRPDWRLGQMLGILAAAAGRDEVSAIWDLADAEALEVATHLVEQHRD